MPKQVKRIELLSKLERDALYARPNFNDLERYDYFVLNEQEQKFIKKYTQGKTRLYFLLQMGYFKAKQQFFSFTLEEVMEDAHFINQLYFKKKINEMAGKISRKYLKLQKNDILKLYDYHLFWGNEEKINAHLSDLIRIYPKPHNALRQLLVYFEQQQIIVPGYRKLQDLFTDAYRTEKNRLNILLVALPKNIQNKLDKLIQKDTGISELNLVRADQKNFQYTAIKLEVEKATNITVLYQHAKLFIPTLGLSHNAVRYYADLTEQYPASRLRRLKKPQPWLYMLCFIHHRYQQLMDNLITSFSYHVRSIMEEEKTHSNSAQMEHAAKIIGEFPKLSKFLKWFPKQKNKPNLIFSELSKRAYKILPEAQFLLLAEFIEGTDFDKKSIQWNFYAKSSRTFALYLRPILLSVHFEYYIQDHAILKLINTLKNHYLSGKSPSSLKLSNASGLAIPKSMEYYLKKNPKDDYFDPHRFEFFVYQKMYHHIDRGRLFCNDSLSYKDLDADLVPDERVDQVIEIAKKYGYEKIPIFCDEHLDTLLDKLEKAWDKTTESIQLGHNKGIRFKQTADGKLDWHLLYDASDELDEQFLSHLPKVEIANMLKFVGDKIRLWDKFVHAKGRYAKKKKANPKALNACILAEAFGLSMEEMAEMSDLNYDTLRSTREDFFSVATLCETNNLVADYIYSLPIFKLWNLIEDKLLADADGQKIASTNNTLQSRYSKKFLGKDKGISIYTLLINFVAVNAKNIGPNEYEGHFLYDMVYGNKTEIAIDMVSGDNHSLNRFNFVFLDSIDVDYVPNIKNIREAANDLYSVKSIENYQGTLKPKGKINQDRIRTEKRGILRVLISLLIQENTQSTIIRKLHSHARYARLKAGLLEYNKIFKSTHVLHLIHDMQFRKALKSSRNRTELFHSLQKVIRQVHHGIFKGKKIKDNRISAHATRLVANCIVAYNAMVLNMLYEKMLAQGVSPEVLKEFARIAPIAWSYLIFTGKYSFIKNNGEIDVALLVEILEKFLKDFLKQE